MIAVQGEIIRHIECESAPCKSNPAHTIPLLSPYSCKFIPFRYLLQLHFWTLPLSYIMVEHMKAMARTSGALMYWECKTINHWKWQQRRIGSAEGIWYACLHKRGQWVQELGCHLYLYKTLNSFGIVFSSNDYYGKDTVAIECRRKKSAGWWL